MIRAAAVLLLTLSFQHCPAHADAQGTREHSRLHELIDGRRPVPPSGKAAPVTVIDDENIRPHNVRAVVGAGRSDLGRTLRLGLEAEAWFEPNAALGLRLTYGNDSEQSWENRQSLVAEPNLLARFARWGVASLVGGVGFGLIRLYDFKDKLCIPIDTGTACVGESRRWSWDWTSSAQLGLRWHLRDFIFSQAVRAEQVGMHDWAVTFNLGGGIAANSR